MGTLVEKHQIEELETGYSVEVEKHQIEGLETGYSVELFDRLGKTITVVTLPESSLRLPTHSVAGGTQRARPSVRLVNNPTV